MLVTPHFAPERGGVPRLLSTIVASSGSVAEWRVVTTAQAPLQEPGAEGGIDQGALVTRTATTKGLISAALQTRGWLRPSSDDRVVCGHPYYMPVAVAIAELLRVPVVGLAYGRELVPTKAAHRVALSALRACRTVVTISERSAREVAARGVSAERIAIVHPVLPPVWNVQTPRRRNTNDMLRMVMVSRMAEGYKNFELAIRVAGILGRAGVVESLTIIGDGPRRSALEDFGDSVGSTQYLRIVGSIHDEAFSDLLATMHVGLFPSRESAAEGGFEGFGLVVHELAASGIPVVASAVAGALDALNPAWAIGVDPDDVHAWVQAVERLGADESARAALSHAGLAWGQSIDVGSTARQYCEAIAA
jgi:glycosyltransferase involved in cell wall biosynthesis